MPGWKREAAGEADRQRPIAPPSRRPVPPGEVLQRQVHERRRDADRDDAAKRGSPSPAPAQDRDQAGDGDPEQRSVGPVAQSREASVDEPPLLSRQAVKETPVEVIKGGERPAHGSRPLWGRAKWAPKLPANPDASVQSIHPAAPARRGYAGSRRLVELGNLARVGRLDGRARREQLADGQELISAFLELGDDH